MKKPMPRAMALYFLMLAVFVAPTETSNKSLREREA
jgi:hypothetical protein